MAGGMMTGIITVYYGQGMMPGICPLAIGAALGAAGGLLPDIDSRNSMAGHTLPLLSKLVCKITGHRGILHTPLTSVLMILLILLLYQRSVLPYIGFVTVLAFPAGYLMHLVQDTCTRTGVAWLYPVCKERFSLVHTGYGSRFEIIVTVLLIAGMIQCCNLIFTGGFVKLIHF